MLIASGAVALTGVFVALAAAAPSRRTPATAGTQTPALQQQDGQSQVPQDQQQQDPFGGGFDDGSGSQGSDDNGGGLTPPSRAPSGVRAVPVAPTGGS